MLEGHDSLVAEKGCSPRPTDLCFFFLSIPSRVVLNVWRKKKKKGNESEWEKKPEKRRDLILHITVLLIQTSQIISPRVYTCGYIFH